MIRIYLERGENELQVAKILKKITEEKEAKKYFELEEESTFYSSVISHSYYAVFFTAKAMLLSKGIKTEMPDVHKKTYEAFEENFVKTGVLDVELLRIYQRMIVRADELLQIFKDEKWKRGHFTYQTIPQANKEPAEQSINNALTFLKNIRLVLERGIPIKSA
ncbi:HEPN domain protein [uncultured archaeon]|nr:HEPN domain protein [uncultured archaeon]